MLIAFDLDGVLYTSEAFLADAYRESIADVNRRRPGAIERVPTSEEILRHVGWPVPTILARLFPEADRGAVDLIYETTLEVICARVRRGEGRVFDGVAETLDELRLAGHDLVVASNGRRPYVEAVLSTYDLAPRFGALFAVDPGGCRDKGELLRAYVERHGARADEVVMVGDRASDVEAAVAVGCRFVGCDYGHGHRDEVEGHGPVISAFRALPAVIREMAEESR